MKYKGIFGIVVLIHIGLGLFVVTQPGCQTTQQSDQVAPNPIIGPVDESELSNLDAEPVAPIASDPEDDLFRPLDASFNSGAPEPVLVGPSAEDVVSTGGSSRLVPLRPEEPISSQPIGVLSFAPEVEDSSPEETITVMSDEPVKESYTVSSGDSLWAISRKFNVSVSSIRIENGLVSDSLKIGQVLVIPLTTREVSIAAPPRESVSPSVSQDIEGSEYVVVPRDTLSGIAKKTGVSVSVIRSANNLQGDLIKVGDILILPAQGNLELPSSVTPSVSPASSNLGVYHVVESGENPTIIARRYGITVKELLAKNGNFDPRGLRVGQRLLVGDLASDVEQPLEVDAPAPTPATPAGFQPVTPTSSQGAISVEIPEATPSGEPEFDEEAFLRELEEAPVVSPVPVE
ncbi:MAG: LysM peptidoglycan-binding domain-containing protein [Verrucomicrobiota bacterium]